MPYRPCIFCGETDSPPSREHVLPTWIAREFAEAKWQRTNLVTGEKFMSREDLGLVTRKPCNRCNTGWMCALGGEAKPILAPLMAGLPSVITIEQQAVIIRWLVKTVMTHELLGGEMPPFFNPKERKAIMEGGVLIEADTLMFLARHVGSQDIRTRSIYVPLLIGDSADRPIGVDGYTTTFAVKQLAFQIFAIRRPPDISSDNSTFANLPGNWDDASAQIWPIGGDISWPPRRLLDDDGFELFINRWSSLVAPQGP